MPILNYTTKVNPDRTVTEIQKILAAKGALRVSVDYDGGKVSAVVFALNVTGQTVEFRLPVKPEGVFAALKKQRVDARYATKEHAESVAWRIVKDWVQAQLALVEAEQAVMAEVFLPYAIINGQTVFKLFEAQQAKGLITDGGTS